MATVCQEVNFIIFCQFKNIKLNLGTITKLAAITNLDKQPFPVIQKFICKSVK